MYFEQTIPMEFKNTKTLYSLFHLSLLQEGELFVVQEGELLLLLQCNRKLLPLRGIKNFVKQNLFI